MENTLIKLTHYDETKKRADHTAKHRHETDFRTVHTSEQTIQKSIIYMNTAPLSDIQIFYIKYLTMHKVHMHTGAIRLCVCTGDNLLAKARGL